MNRLQALEAVATRVRIWCATRPELNKGFDTFHDTQALFDAIQALDALPDDPAPAEVVEVAVWEGMTGLIEHVKAGSIRDQQEAFGPLWRRVGTTRLPLVLGDGA